jgi:nucleoside phosphorylase
MDLDYIFIYHLDYEIVKLFGLDDNSIYRYNEVKECFNLATRIAFLLCNKSIIVPLSNYFESSMAFDILNNLQSKETRELNLIVLVSNSCSFEEFLDKKITQHGDNIKNKGYHYSDFINKNGVYIPGTYKIRLNSASYDIKKIWTTDKDIGTIIDDIHKKVDYKYTHSQVANMITRVPETLGSRAYISSYITPLLGMEGVNFSIIDKALNKFITLGYIKSFLDEYHAVALNEIPYIDCNYILPKGAEYSYLSYQEYVSKMAGRNYKGNNMLDYVKKCSADDLLEFKYSTSWKNICTKSNKTVMNKTKMVMDMEHSNIDVLILIATEEEEKAIIKNDNWKTLVSKKGYTYYIKIEGMTFALARAVDMRETEVSIVAQYFIDELNPRFISMAGFCAGKVGKTSLGDIIVPYKIYKYGMGKQVSRGQTYPEIDSFRIEPIWKQKVERFGEKWREKCSVGKPLDYSYQRYVFMDTIAKSKESINPFEIWKREEMPDLPRVMEEFKEKKHIRLISGRIKLTERGRNEINNELVLKYWGGYKEVSPKTKVGVLATGDNVQQWSGIFDILEKENDRKTIALDMESHAIGCIASFNRKPYIIAKGVGDYAQDNKAFDNRYIEYSCHNSCRFLIAFFNSLEGEEFLNV